MQVTLSTGRALKIAPLTIQRVKQLAEFSEALGAVQTVQDDIALMTARLNACHEAVQRAGSKQTLQELDDELTISEVDELFNAVVSLTIRQTTELPAFSRKRGSIHDNRN